MENLNALLVKDKAELSEVENEFLTLHETILYAGSTATAYFVEFAKKLKEMRDSKLYETVGFNNFAEYVEQAVNIKQRQAYKYIEVYENFSEEFLKRNSKLGVTKLLLITSLDEEEKEQIATEIVENGVTVEELKKIIDEKESRISQLELDLKENNQKVIEQSNQKIEKAKKALEKALKDKEDLTKRYEELKTSPAKVDVIEKPETLAELKSLREKLNKSDEEIVSLKKQIQLNGNGKLMVFKVKFEELQVYLSDINALIEEMDAEDKVKCQKALKVVVGAYL